MRFPEVAHRGHHFESKLHDSLQTEQSNRILLCLYGLAWSLRHAAWGRYENGAQARYNPNKEMKAVV